MRNLSKINFCELPIGILIQLIEFILPNSLDVLTKGNLTEKLENKVKVEVRWSYYDEIIVTPTEIFFQPDPYPRRSVFDIEDILRYEKIIKLLKNG